MTRLEDRQILVRDIAQARGEGARLGPACTVAGVDARTLQRWKAGDGLARGDRRPGADRPVPSHALSVKFTDMVSTIVTQDQQHVPGPECALLPGHRRH